MPSDPEQAEPLRLTQSEGPAGALLEAANEEFKDQLDETGAWRRLRERQARRSRAPKSLLITAAAGALAAGVVLWGRTSHHPEVTAETIKAREISKPTPPVQTNPEDKRSASVVPANHPRADLVVRGPRVESTCDDLAAKGQLAPAVDCYEELGTDHGLYEAGRLSAERLGDAPKALRLLEARKQKFPSGPERIEAELLRARTLVTQGRAQEAIAVTDQLLADSSNRKALPLIHSVRAHAFQDALHDCGQALRDLSALVGEPGAIGDDGALRRALCLETLHRTQEARAAFEDYLKRPEPRSATLAREHLDALMKGSIAP